MYPYLQTLTDILDGSSIAALRVLLSRGPARARQVIGETLRAAPREATHVIGATDLLRAFPMEQDVVVHGSGWHTNSIAPLERYIIGHLIKFLKPRKLLEVGTFEGHTTRLMLENASVDCQIATIDLEREDGRVGIGFADHPRQNAIVQVLGNTFEEATWNSIDCVDFCFIDAAHSYQAVQNDTEKVRRVLAENGVIVWHDYTSSAGNKTFAVGRYIRDQMKSHDSIFVCAHTTLAIHIPVPMLLEGEARIARFYDEEVLRERHPDGPFHWLHKRF
jgi:predicted O-methyltransferase YrrM